MKVLFFGDIVGKVGRNAVVAALAEWKKKYQPDFVIANAENIAHGKGVTFATLEELKAGGVDGFTGGNHIWSKADVFDIIGQKAYALARPLNFPAGTPGAGFFTLEKNGMKLSVVSLIGQVGMPQQADNPFAAIDALLPSLPADAPVFVDFHAEATSEKVAMGWHLDGRAHAVVGTHTHVPTADEGSLKKGTVYQTDAGMCGPWDSVIGVEKEDVIRRFLTQMPARHEYAETGLAVVNASLLELNLDFKGQTITRLQTKIDA